MTAPQHTAQPAANQKNSKPVQPRKASQGYSLQRCWFVSLGWLGSFGFVVSQMSFARAESGLMVSDHAASGNAMPVNYTVADTSTAAAFELAPASQSAPVQPEPAQIKLVQPEPTAAPTPITSPTVTPPAPPTFTAVEKSTAVKADQRSSPLVGLMESEVIAAPLSDYVGSSIAMATGTQAPSAPVNEVVSDAAPLRNTSAVGIAQTPPAEAIPEAVPDILPAPQAAPPVVDIAPPAAVAEPVRPAETVPIALPEGSSLPDDSVFVDPTDYSVGATSAPEVVVSEQSTGCQFTVGANQSVPRGACASTASGGQPGSQTASQTGSQSAPVANRPTLPSARPAASASAVNVGPVSFSAAGIRFSGSTTAAGRDYLNRSVRPLVNLQMAQRFIFPLAIPSPITSLFGFRIHPITGDHRFHAGTDIGAAQGTPVLAAQDGVVDSADYAGGYGLMVVLTHPDEETPLQSRYAHLSEILVEPGKTVKKGDVIGLVGSTGNSTGPHLHFEMLQYTADGWVLMNPDALIQTSLASLVKALNHPMQAMSFNLSDLSLKRGGVTDSSTPNSTVELPLLPGQNGVSFRPAQPNAS